MVLIDFLPHYTHSHDGIFSTLDVSRPSFSSLARTHASLPLSFSLSRADHPRSSSTQAFYSTDELYFIEREFGSSVPWENRALYEKWNPGPSTPLSPLSLSVFLPPDPSLFLANHVASWTTPQMVIHGGRDFRLGESHGLAAFSALQRQGVPSRFLYFEKENHWCVVSLLSEGRERGR